jgi:hypothetical protein
MTIEAMVKYFEDRGFKTTKKYISERKVYEFRIKKLDVTAFGEYEFIPGLHPSKVCEIQQAFLEDLMRTWVDAYERSLLFASSDPFRRVLPNMDVASLYPDTLYMTTRSLDDTVLHKQVAEYIKNDIENTERILKTMNSITITSRTSIKDVIFNDPATIVFWADGTKTVVKCQENDTFDPEVGLAMAIAKKALGNKGNYCNTIKKWIEKDVKEKKGHVDYVIPDFIDLNKIDKE